MKLDGLIIIGGDGSMQILKKLAKDGDMKIVAIPKTIDNDVGATESSIGFHTAVDVATQALDNLQSTAASHRRSMILEVCLLYTSPSPRDLSSSRMPSSA